MLITRNVWNARVLKNVNLRLRSGQVLMLLLLKICLVFGQHKTVVIDPGHGGLDSGAVGVNGIKEKDIVFEVAKEIIRLNRTLFDGQQNIYLTRYKDTLVPLSDRTKLAKTLNADVFVSLHCNHSDNPNAKGVEVYVYNRENSFSRQSIWLGYSLQKGLNEKLGFKSRGVKFADFQVLREAGGYLAVLMELGFLSNDDEKDYYLKPKNIRALALSILTVTLSYPYFLFQTPPN